MASLTIEEALSLTGYGKFHYSLAICCAFSLLAAGIQNGINAYILPVALCDLKLTSAQLGYLNASFLIGGISSAFIWGLLADLLGRKKVIMVALLSDWCITICAGLSQTYVSLLIFRYLNGFLIGSPSTLAFSYFAEFQPERIRNKAVCFIGIFFSVAWILLPAVAWIVMPLPWEIRYESFILNSWRIYIIFMSLPSLISGLWMMFLPESPKFLLARGNSQQALIVLKYMFTVNTGKTSDKYQVPLLKNNTVKHLNNHVKSENDGKIVRLLKDIHNQITQLFTRPLIFYTILTSVINFANMFGYLGLGLWMPEILSRFEAFHKLYPNESTTICELRTEITVDESIVKSIVNTTIYKSELDEPINCGSNLDESVFMNTFVMGACCILGNFISACFAAKVSRRVLPIVTMLVGAISAASIYWLNSSIQHLIMGSLFQASMATANTVLNGVIVDMFPTAVSAMAVCTAALAGRFGAVVSNLVLGYLLDQSCEIPLIVIVITLSIGTALGILIPVKDIFAKEEVSAEEVYKPISDLSALSNLQTK